MKSTFSILIFVHDSLVNDFSEVVDLLCLLKFHLYEPWRHIMKNHC